MVQYNICCKAFFETNTLNVFNVCMCIVVCLIVRLTDKLCCNNVAKKIPFSHFYICTVAHFEDRAVDLYESGMAGWKQKRGISSSFLQE